MTKDVQLVLGLALVGGIIYFAHKSANLQNESKSNFRGRSVRGRSGRCSGRTRKQAWL
jgi:hypothetical protein